MNTEQDVQKFWDEVKQLELANQSPDPVTEYRLYYNETGDIVHNLSVIVNRELPELPAGPYLVVSLEDYKNSANKVVVDRRLEKKNFNINVKLSLVKSTKGFCVVKNNAALLIQENENYQDTEYYDRRTSD